MLHPVGVIALLEVLACVCATGFLAVSCSVDGLDGVGEQVLELEGLDEVRVPGC